MHGEPGNDGPMTHRLSSRAAVLRVATVPALAVIAIATLVGCQPEAAGPSPSATSGSPNQPTSPSATSSVPTPGGTATASVTPTPGANPPLGRSCEQLISAQTIYDYNPNFVAISASASSGSGAAAAITAGGIACAWQNTTSSETIVLGAARYSAAQLATVKATATGSAVSGWGDFGRFSRANNAGIASFAVGNAWATLTSTAFFASPDAAPLVQSVASALG